jgi:HEAT repeat protein
LIDRNAKIEVEAPEGDEEASAGGGSAGRLVVQLFVIPLFIVAIAVFVFWLFGTIAVDKKAPAELLNEVRTGSRNQRWQSAFELSRRLPAIQDPAARSAFAEQTMKAYQAAGNDDPRVRRYLALVLGRLGEPRAVPLLEGALADPDTETRLYALWALALIGDPSSAPKVRPLLDSEDPGIRKTAAFAAGRMEDADAIPALKKLLGDPAVDVRWNAALALATLDDASGRDVLVQMTDRSVLAKVPGLSADQQDDAVLNGLRGLVLLKDADAAKTAERLKASDPSLRVRREVPKISGGGRP